MSSGFGLTSSTDVGPSLQIRNPRGLSEKQLDHLRVEMRRRCQELEGCPVAFELLDLGREYLTANNVPRASPCPICLEPFEGPSKSGTETSESSGTFCKTPCFHHFHKVCLGRYLRHLRADDLADKDNLADGRKIPCPVCRTDLGPGMASMDPGDDDDVNDEVERDEAVDEELKEQLARFRRERRRLDPVFQRQLRAGGIIDLEAEQPPVVVLSSAIGLGTRDSSQPSAGGTKCPPPPAPAPPPPSAAAATTTDDDPGEGPSSVRRGHHDRGQKPHRKNRPPRRGNSRR